MAANKLPRSVRATEGKPRFAHAFASAFGSMVESSMEKQLWVRSGKNMRDTVRRLAVWLKSGMRESCG